MKGKRILNLFGFILGLMMIVIGFILFANGEDYKTIPGILIGVGAGILGLTGGEIINSKLDVHAPSYKRHIEIEANDERNIYINQLAKSKSYDVMLKVLAVLMIVYLLLNESLLIILLLLGAYLIKIGTYIFYFNKYYQE